MQNADCLEKLESRLSEIRKSCRESIDFLSERHSECLGDSFGIEVLRCLASKIELIDFIVNEIEYIKGSAEDNAGDFLADIRNKTESFRYCIRNALETLNKPESCPDWSERYDAGVELLKALDKFSKKWNN